MQRVRRWFLGLLLLSIVMAGVLFVYGQRVLEQPGPLTDARTIVIPHGGVRTAAAALERAGAVGSETQFLIAAWITRGEGSLRAAELAFPAHASLRDVLTVLRTGRPVQHLLAIPEGLTATQIAALILRADALSGPVERPEEGSVLPETYAYEYGIAREAIIERGRIAMDRALAKAWAERAQGLPLTSPRDALILASIVERETARPEERAHIASVYLNRLRLGMKLQADPTVVYGASGGTGVLDRSLTRADLEHDDSYNTYRLRGLPVGPIASPGLASLNAVVQPDRSDDLFFVADGSGGHVFARTLEEHQRNIARTRSATPAAARPG